MTSDPRGGKGGREDVCGRLNRIDCLKGKGMSGRRKIAALEVSAGVRTEGSVSLLIVYVIARVHAWKQPQKLHREAFVGGGGQMLGRRQAD